MSSKMEYKIFFIFSETAIYVSARSSAVQFPRPTVAVAVAGEWFRLFLQLPA